MNVLTKRYLSNIDALESEFKIKIDEIQKVSIEEVDSKFEEMFQNYKKCDGYTFEKKTKFMHSFFRNYVMRNRNTFYKSFLKEKITTRTKGNKIEQTFLRESKEKKVLNLFEISGDLDYIENDSELISFLESRSSKSAVNLIIDVHCISKYEKYAFTVLDEFVDEFLNMAKLLKDHQIDLKVTSFSRTYKGMEIKGSRDFSSPGNENIMRFGSGRVLNNIRMRNNIFGNSYYHLRGFGNGINKLNTQVRMMSNPLGKRLKFGLLLLGGGLWWKKSE
jgi:hypothetical protein